jgi:hypothetical protein
MLRQFLTESMIYGKRKALIFGWPSPASLIHAVQTVTFEQGKDETIFSAYQIAVHKNFDIAKDYARYALLEEANFK